MSRNSWDVGTGAISFQVVFMAGGECGGDVWKEVDLLLPFAKLFARAVLGLAYRLEKVT